MFANRPHDIEPIFFSSQRNISNPKYMVVCHPCTHQHLCNMYVLLYTMNISIYQQSIYFRFVNIYAVFKKQIVSWFHVSCDACQHMPTTIGTARILSFFFHRAFCVEASDPHILLQIERYGHKPSLQQPFLGRSQGC